MCTYLSVCAGVVTVCIVVATVYSVAASICILNLCRKAGKVLDGVESAVARLKPVFGLLGLPGRILGAVARGFSVFHGAKGGSSCRTKEGN